jgi:NAD(P)-dependent dehydrogenase (short-subunit alcohol dehydrogenase family)
VSSSRVIVLGASSDIGAHLTEHYLRGGAEVVGTYRSRTSRVAELEAAGARLFPLNIDSPDQVKRFAQQLKADAWIWDVLISAPGLLDPIGPFFSTDFGAWEKSVITNSTAQLHVLHAIYDQRNATTLSKVIFFAGGGTNGPFDNYSAYCIGKLSLIKMTELLDSECPDLQVSIIGTGWVNTKIHQQTLAAGEAAGLNFDKTRQFMGSPEGVSASLETVAECIDWCLAAPRDAVGGRNFSLVHDEWRDPAFIDMLKADPNIYKLRRLS